ncbi:MAG: FHA domain-containing protein [Gemmataceae bacterium]
MSLPAPNPINEPIPSGGPRLEVRLGGRTVSYPINRDTFTIGSGLGCDLRIPGKQVPATFCRIERSAQSFLLRPLSLTFPILLNGQTIDSEQSLILQAGDRLTLGPADAVVYTGTPVVRPKLFVPIDPPQAEQPVYLHPGFVPEERGTGWDNVRLGDFTIEPEPHPIEAFETPTPTIARVPEPMPAQAAAQAPAPAPTPASAPVAPPVSQVIQLDGLHAQLLARSRELDERAAELEADRVLWYRRRQEMEHELQNAPREDHWRTREADLATKELDLARVRDELSTLRQSLYDQYRERRDQLSEMQDALRAQSASIGERERAVRERETAAENRWQDADRLRAEAAGYEQKIVLLHEKEARLDAAMAEVERQKGTISGLRDELARDRETFDRERTLHESRWQEQDRMISSREADLARREGDLRNQSAELEKERIKAVHAVAAYDARFAELEARQHSLDVRAAEVDARHSQLLRDAADLEEQLKLVDDKERLIREEHERFERIRADFSNRETKLAERHAAVESQHAALAVLRSALDRRQTELQQTETHVAGTRHALLQTQSEIDTRLVEAERLRNELGTVREDAESERRALAERKKLLDTELEEIRRQKDTLHDESNRLAARETELDDRTRDLAEQTATLKARVQRVLDLQERLELDRRAIRERESTLGRSDTARLGLQDHLRRRAEELTTRARQLDETSVRFAEEKVEIEKLRRELDTERQKFVDAVRDHEQEMAARHSEIERQLATMQERELSLSRQVARLRDVGQTVAAERKNLFESRQNWERERAAILAADEERQHQLSSFHQNIASDVEALSRQAPELESRAQAAMAQLAAARDVLRGQLEELHAFAGHGRGELDSAREQLRQESDRLRERERQLELARAEHRHATATFRQQMVEWQANLADLKQSLSRGETVVDTKKADLDSFQRMAEERNRELARREEELRDARRQVAAQRGELDRHLQDMRDWYKKKLRELASQNADQANASAAHGTPEEELSPGDRHLGELLRTRDLIDEPTLTTLWNEAIRQRRTLRHVLLSSGTLTIYQLALIEAGNLDGLMIGRFRIMDRVRSTPRETVYKVYDPERSGEPFRGIVALRLLGDAERFDAVRPDEYRQRFAALARASHPNLGNTLDVLELAGRPAAVQEWVGGLASGEWPVVSPGVWLKLFTDTASGVAHCIGPDCRTVDWHPIAFMLRPSVS